MVKDVVVVRDATEAELIGNSVGTYSHTVNLVYPVPVLVTIAQPMPAGVWFTYIYVGPKTGDSSVICYRPSVAWCEVTSHLRTLFGGRRGSQANLLGDFVELARHQSFVDSHS